MSRQQQQTLLGSTILGTGHAAPDRIVTSTEIENRLDLEPGWIERRTGIRERRWAAENEAVSDISIQAGQMALNQSGLSPDTIALTILATSTPDHLLPPTAPLVAHRLGLTNSGGIDMAGACAGFLYALTFADSFVRIHHQPVMVIAANILSRRINEAERASAVLFADAAGAVVLAPSDRPGTGILGLDLKSDGGSYDLIKIPAGGSRVPFSHDLAEADTKMTISDGQAVFAKAVSMMIDTSQAALAMAGCASNDIDHWIPHQANTRIIEATRTRLKIPTEKTLSTVETFGNSSAASIPFTWSRCSGEKSLRPGQKVLLSAAGAGLTGGAVVYGL